MSSVGAALQVLRQDSQYWQVALLSQAAMDGMQLVASQVPHARPFEVPPSTAHFVLHATSVATVMSAQGMA